MNTISTGPESRKGSDRAAARCRAAAREIKRPGDAGEREEDPCSCQLLRGRVALEASCATCVFRPMHHVRTWCDGPTPVAVVTKMAWQPTLVRPIQMGNQRESVP